MATYTRNVATGPWICLVPEHIVTSIIVNICAVSFNLACASLDSTSFCCTRVTWYTLHSLLSCRPNHPSKSHCDQFLGSRHPHDERRDDRTGENRLALLSSSRIASADWMRIPFEFGAELEQHQGKSRDHLQSSYPCLQHRTKAATQGLITYRKTGPETAPVW